MVEALPACAQNVASLLSNEDRMCASITTRARASASPSWARVQRPAASAGHGGAPASPLTGAAVLQQLQRRRLVAARGSKRGHGHTLTVAAATSVATAAAVLVEDAKISRVTLTRRTWLIFRARVS